MRPHAPPPDLENQRAPLKRSFTWPKLMKRGSDLAGGFLGAALTPPCFTGSPDELDFTSDVEAQPQIVVLPHDLEMRPKRGSAAMSLHDVEAQGRPKKVSPFQKVRTLLRFTR